jgi:hypothetical protein
MFSMFSLWIRNPDSKDEDKKITYREKGGDKFLTILCSLRQHFSTHLSLRIC